MSALKLFSVFKMEGQLLNRAQPIIFIRNCSINMREKMCFILKLEFRAILDKFPFPFHIIIRSTITIVELR